MRIKLTPEQEKILKVVEGGANVFITGSTGKSFLLRQIIKSLKMKYPARPDDISDAVAITASTGKLIDFCAAPSEKAGHPDKDWLLRVSEGSLSIPGLELPWAKEAPKL
ncbi:hypothetical protein B0H19DRAFT_962506 [Mycena capillaripes]|nr:hypothetical protein B0H19DRAFT_962506 [Mycena capillaripes]